LANNINYEDIYQNFEVNVSKKNNLTNKDINYLNFYVKAKNQSMMDNMDQMKKRVGELIRLREAEMDAKQVKSKKEEILSFVDDRVNKIGILLNVVMGKRDDAIRNFSHENLMLLQTDFLHTRIMLAGLLKQNINRESDLPSLGKIKEVMDKNSFILKSTVIKDNPFIYKEMDETVKKKIDKNYSKSDEIFTKNGNGLFGKGVDLVKNITKAYFWINLAFLSIILISAKVALYSQLGLQESQEEPPKQKQDEESKDLKKKKLKAGGIALE